MSGNHRSGSPNQVDGRRRHGRRRYLGGRWHWLRNLLQYRAPHARSLPFFFPKSCVAILQRYCRSGRSASSSALYTTAQPCSNSFFPSQLLQWAGATLFCLSCSSFCRSRRSFNGYSGDKILGTWLSSIPIDNYVWIGLQTSSVFSSSFWNGSICRNCLNH